MFFLLFRVTAQDHTYLQNVAKSLLLVAELIQYILNKTYL